MRRLPFCLLLSLCYAQIGVQLDVDQRNSDTYGDVSTAKRGNSATPQYEHMPNSAMPKQVYKPAMEVQYANNVPPAHVGNVVNHANAIPQATYQSAPHNDAVLHTRAVVSQPQYSYTVGAQIPQQVQHDSAPQNQFYAQQQPAEQRPVFSVVQNSTAPRPVLTQQQHVAEAQPVYYTQNQPGFDPNRNQVKSFAQNAEGYPTMMREQRADARSVQSNLDPSNNIIYSSGAVQGQGSAAIKREYGQTGPVQAAQYNVQYDYPGTVYKLTEPAVSTTTGASSATNRSDETFAKQWEELMKNFKAQMILTFKLSGPDPEQFYQDIPEVGTLIRGGAFENRAKAADAATLSIISPSGKVVFTSQGDDTLFRILSEEAGRYSFVLSTPTYNSNRYVTFLMGTGEEIPLSVTEVNTLEGRIKTLSRKIAEIETQSSLYSNKKRAQTGSIKQITQRTYSVFLIEVLMAGAAAMLQYFSVRKLLAQKSVY